MQVAKSKKPPKRSTPRAKRPAKVRLVYPANTPPGSASDARSYDDVLTFSVHALSSCAIDTLSPGVRIDRYDWDEAQCEVARAALNAGLQIAVDVPEGAVAWALSAIGRVLNMPVCAGYDSRNERLILWAVPNDDDPEPDVRDTCCCCRCACKP